MKIKKLTNKLHNEQKGSIIVSILIVSIFLTTIISGIIVLANTNLTRAKSRVLLLQAQYAAESGVDSAIAVINGGNESYTGSNSEVTILTNAQYKSTYTVSVAPGSSGKEKKITATGKLYVPANAVTASFSRSIEVTAQRTSTSTGTSILSRNIIEASSGVKNITSKDIYTNGYINLNKNTTNLIAENITVVDKKTGASNCSIGGSGNLVKPTSFTNPGQTKTNITLGFNNCISPPGNTSNSNFNVLANQTNLTKIQSTLIPWSQYMDVSYSNAPNGCGDWSFGSSPYNIPRTGNSKKSHYPDTGSNVSSSCGTNGDLALGSSQYNIKDNVHVRANFCASSACAPIFNNPNSDLVFVFIEGTVNFNSIRTANGSGPIAFVVYGADPASKTSACPYGGSIYIGQGSPGSYTAAPKLYLLSVNGVCIEKTKFGASPALGGVSGKNIYIDSSPGTPFDLNLDPLFPTSLIPVDLSWRAVLYRRL